MITMIRNEFMSIVCPKFRENPSEALAEELKTECLPIECLFFSIPCGGGFCAAVPGAIKLVPKSQVNPKYELNTLNTS